MKTYNDGYVMRFAPIDSEWVPAEVARGLHDALDELVRNIGPDFEYDSPGLVERARAALKATEES